MAQGSERAALLAVTLLVCLVCGCATHPPSQEDTANDHVALRRELVSLGPEVSSEEAGRVSWAALTAAGELQAEYRLRKPPIWHNALVNLGFRDRGLCYHFAEDLLALLENEEWRTLELHWGVARGGQLREHNCLVVTARDQPFEEGIVLDAWRNSGRLFWIPVSEDRRYPWVEGVLHPEDITPASIEP